MKLWIPILFVVLQLISISIFHLGFFSLMPGDICDARLNNYFLENVYLFLLGRSDSLWHLTFFYPFPYVLGFSDNLFGSAPVYALGRLISGDPYTAFQIWFLCGYVINYIAAYYALRRLGGSTIASTIGALIFSFALPTTAHACHAQLHYRFALPLAILFFTEFLSRKAWPSLIVAGSWLVWQFYCGVYIGFFTLLLLSCMALTYIVYEIFTNKARAAHILGEFKAQWKSHNSIQKISILGAITLLVLLMFVLFYPYLQVSRLYGAMREWGEISSMLPRPQSYFLSDASLLWSAPESRLYVGIPMRHEHQMFIGLLPLFLAVLGMFFCRRNKNVLVVVLMTGMLFLSSALTLYIDGFSLWYFLHKLPLASAIRAITRLDQAILFPIAYLSMIGIDGINERYMGRIIVWVVIIPMLLFEMSATTMPTSSKDAWRERVKVIENSFPENLSRDSIVFLAQDSGRMYVNELDAMWISLNHGIKTLNGYSGVWPPGCSPYYGHNCAEAPKRILWYLDFIGDAGNVKVYQEFMKRLVLIGFEGCNRDWLRSMPSISTATREYTVEEFKLLSYEIERKHILNDRSEVNVKIVNSGTQPFAARSSVGRPIRISWRFLDADGNPLNGWDTRMDIPFDIPAKGELIVRIPVNPPLDVKGGILQVSLVQEMVFWAHDIGIPPAAILWD